MLSSFTVAVTRGGKSKSQMSSLFTADFPPYTIFALREGEFYIAGGGGIAKTGVPNALVSEISVKQLLLRYRYF